MSEMREIPCKIGDKVWAVYQWKGKWRGKCERVSEIFFVGEEMKLCIAVRHTCRGEWGDTIFATKAEAMERANEIIRESRRSNENRCILCGEIIPEGRQVCPMCEWRYRSED